MIVGHVGHVGHVGDVSRFASAGHFASYNATAPIEASSGEQKRHRLNQRNANDIEPGRCDATLWFDLTNSLNDRVCGAGHCYARLAKIQAGFQPK